MRNAIDKLSNNPRFDGAIKLQGDDKLYRKDVYRD